MEEEWKRIVINEQETNYEISNLGRGRNLDHLNWKSKGILTPKFNRSNGYYSYCINFNGKQYYRYVHRLVAQAFIPNPNNLPQVNHIDGDKSNNKLDNLEWCDGIYNMKHAFKNELVASATPVTIYTLKGEKIADFESISEAVRFILQDKRSNYTIQDGLLDQDINNVNRQSYGVQWRLRDGDIRPVYDISQTCQRYNIPIVKLTMKRELIKIYPQIHMAYIEMGKIDNGAISQVCKGNRGSFNGFLWMYYDEYLEKINKTTK